MSWHIEVCGNREEVLAVIAEAAAAPHSTFPDDVRGALVCAVGAVPDKAFESNNLFVKSSGHRPQEWSGSSETTEVRLIRKRWT